MATWVARPTTYKGIRMRSRLEARFAAELDRVGLPWTYEPGAFADESGQYLPDFAITGGDPIMYFEVKPTLDDAGPVMERMEIIWSSEPLAALVLVVPDGDGWFHYRACVCHTERDWQEWP